MLLVRHRAVHVLDRWLIWQVPGSTFLFGIPLVRLVRMLFGKVVCLASAIENCIVRGFLLCRASWITCDCGLLRVLWYMIVLRACVMEMSTCFCAIEDYNMQL